MKRRFADLGARDGFDLLVIGGGVLGAWTAYDAALRGLRVALVERTDWAAGTSSRSSKLIHGGLRYLEYGRLGQVRAALGERRRLLRLAPHRVRPLRFVLPLYRGMRLGRLRLRAGLWLYDRLAGAASGGVTGHGALAAARMRRLYPFLRPTDLTGGLTYGDCLTDDARYVLEIVDGAASAGVAAVNGAEVTSLVRHRKRVVGAVVRDTESGTVTEVRASVTANCSGPWAAALTGDNGGSPSRLSKGVHLVLPGLPVEDAFLLLGEDPGRVVFLIPWYGRTLLGTTDTDFRGSPDSVTVEAEDRDYLLRQANRCLDPGWRHEDILAEFAGVRTLPNTGGPPEGVTRECIVAEPHEGLLTPVGGKLSSARLDAEKLVSRALDRLGRRGPCTTAGRPFPWAPERRPDALPQSARGIPGLDDDVATACHQRYGSRIADLHTLLMDEPDLARRLVGGLPFCRAEIVHAARHEMPLTLEDVLRRRLPLALLGALGPEVIEDAADLAGRELGWSAERRKREVEAMTGAGRHVKPRTK